MSDSAPAYWRLMLPYPLALPEDLAAEWQARGRTDVFHGSHAAALAASRAAAEPPARQGLFGLEASA